jgi:methyl-accepting chemotaxis protein
MVLVGAFAANRKILTVLGDFSQVFQMRIRRISESGKTMHHVVQTMVAASEQTSRQSQIVRGNTNEATEQVAVVSSSVQDFNVSIRDISRSVTETGQHVEMVVSKASHTSEVIHQLKDATTQISSVVSLINDLAGQTNLLALNAAIEAARAGEAGRGFAVVADEVKKLASNTSTATIDIGQQVTSMQGVAETAVEVLNELVVLIRSIQSNSSTVASAIEEQTTVSASISTASETAAQCVQAVDLNMAGIEQAANDTSQTASDVEGSTQQMEDIVRELDEAMQQTLRQMGVSEKTGFNPLNWASHRLRRENAARERLGNLTLATA